MNNISAQESIDHIKDMIEQTKNRTAGQWKFFLLWGCSIIISIIGMHLLIYLEKYEYIWINWAIFMCGAGVLQGIISAGNKKKFRVKTYAENAVNHLCFSMGLAYFITGFIFPLMKIYSYNFIPVIISVLTGVLLFTTGGIIQWKYLKWNGMLWLLSSLVMIIIKANYRSLLLIPLIVLSYLIPAIKLKKECKNEH